MKPLLGFATVPDCTVRVRLGDLIQSKPYGDALDQWWTLTDLDSFLVVGTEVSNAVEDVGVSFLQSISNYEAIATHLSRMTGGASRTPIHVLNRCLAEWKCGNKSESLRQLEHVSANAWLPKAQAIQALINDESNRTDLDQ